MSAIKSFVYDLLTDGNHLSNIEMNQVSEIMKQQNTFSFQLQGQTKLRLDHHGISFSEDATGEVLQVSVGWGVCMDDNKTLIQNAVEDYIKKISQDPYLKENRLFLNEIYQHLHLSLMAEDMTEESCKLRVVETDS